MSRRVKCPHCKVVGQVSPVDHSENVFRVRGHYNGKAVLVCLRCGYGSYAGLFSGAFVGNPKPIPALEWDVIKEEFEKDFNFSISDPTY